MKDYKESYITSQIRSPLFDSVAALIVMPFMIIGTAVLFIFVLLLLLVMWPLMPFFVYVDRKKEITESIENDRKE
jgi:Na+-transporting methylmalonyl-CoA/oxaloacetate decarboxylase gamma subunit